MPRSSRVLAILVVAACATDPDPALELVTTTQELGGLDVTREHVVADVYHYAFLVPVGDGPNARLRIHRFVRELAPWVPRQTSRAILLNHGDFASTVTNFAPTLGDPSSTAPGLAPWLAARGIDVWGLDRRWTQAPATDPELSDFDAMGLAQELDDLGVALAFVRGVRLLTGGGAARVFLSGFSRGGQLAYYYTAREAATKPPGLRHVRGLVPLDVYAALAPEDEPLRAMYCGWAAGEYEALAAGIVEVPNDFQILTGDLVLADPEGMSPIAPWLTNRAWMLWLVGQTYDFFPASAHYHLNGPVLAEGAAVGLRFASELEVAAWLAGAPAWQSMRESADTDAMLCGDAPPVEAPLSAIEAPLLLIAAVGGYSHHAVFTTTQVASTDVTALVIEQLAPAQIAEDYGHGDLLYAHDAPVLVWQPLLTWLEQH